MSETFSTLSSATVGQNVTFPERFAKNPVRASALEQLRKRNTYLDALFYDVSVVSEEEAVSLAPWLAHEGAILIAPPSGRGTITVEPDVDAFLESDAISTVGALAVAGVGSSALGAAALARNVADGIGHPAAAVVSGYGFADLSTEALGGWFYFGALNSIRHAFEGLDAASRLFQAPLNPSFVPADARNTFEFSAGEGFARLSKDTRAIVQLLGEGGFTPELLVGHSKGNLVISEALYWLKDRADGRIQRLADEAAIVTLCAKIDMPPPFKVFDVTGQFDALGAVNSRWDIPAELVVPGATHTTNRQLFGPLAVDVVAVLREFKRQKDESRGGPGIERALRPPPTKPIAPGPQSLVARLRD